MKRKQQLTQYRVQQNDSKKARETNLNFALIVSHLLHSHVF